MALAANVPQAKSRRRSGYLVLLGAALILTLAAGWQVVLKKTESRGAAMHFDLALRVPEKLSGWQVRNMPLGANELLTEKATDLLRCDEYVYREYSRPGKSFLVYAAYWAPGKMPTRFVSLHTPDRCWVENGWNCLEAKHGVAVGLERLMPGQWRIFQEPSGRTSQYVYFWLLNGGRPYEFGQRLNTIPNPILWWRDVLDEAHTGNPEHLFVRLTSDRRFEELARDPGWEELLQALAKLGLAEEATKSTDVRGQ